jgi:hypothetical protein
VPAGLLLPRVYTVQLLVMLVEDQDGDLPPVTLLDDDVLKVSVSAERPGGEVRAPASPFDWEIAVHSEESAPAATSLSTSQD